MLLPLTLPCLWPAASAQETFRRGLEQITFVPRGQWITGVNVSYTQSDFDNYKFLVIENLGGDTYSFKVSPMLMYAFRDNLPPAAALPIPATARASTTPAWS